ncbi:MAG TPA: N-methyl-L-tryptophan oxidase [Planctomycetota bacterium]|nr:N-methyl-L-tryptophan oxidase [Planctomycetota bacterium]
MGEAEEPRRSPAPPTAPSHDSIVLGTGGVGSAALFHLARRGVRALGLDRFPPGHDRGSSHGETRIIRQAYFEHPDYVPLLLKAYDLWEALSSRCGRRLFFPVGLLQVGPPGGAVVPGVLESAGRFGLEVEALGAREAESRFSGFRVPDGMTAVFEPKAGYLLVEECVRAHAAEAVKLGAELRHGETVLDWKREGSGVVVTTDRGKYGAASLIISAGAWSGEILRGLRLGLEVRRKPAFWYRTRSGAHRAGSGSPTFLYETPAGVFYGFPDVDGGGLKAAEHSGGERVEDPLKVDRSLREPDRVRIEAFLDAHIPGVTRECLRHSVCLYTMSPDEHFIVDRHPAHDRVAFAAGLSGHGFKFAGVLGQALADLVLDGRTALPVAFLNRGRAGS